MTQISMPVSFMPSCQHPSCQHAKNFSKSRCQKTHQQLSCQHLHVNISSCQKPCMPSKQNPSCQHAETFFMSRCHKHANNFHANTFMSIFLHAKTLHAIKTKPFMPTCRDLFQVKMSKKHDDNKRSCQNLHVNILSCQNPLLRITCMPSKQNPSCQHAETFFMSRCLLLWNIVGQQIKQILLNVVPGTRHEGLPRFWILRKTREVQLCLNFIPQTEVCIQATLDFIFNLYLESVVENNNLQKLKL